MSIHTRPSAMNVHMRIIHHTGVVTALILTGVLLLSADEGDVDFTFTFGITSSMFSVVGLTPSMMWGIVRP